MSAARLRLEPYDPSWSRAFDQEAHAIGAILAPVSLELHHIGSTSVPGLLSKPIIDLLGVAENAKRMDSQTDKLRALGYDAKGENGIAGRRYFRKGERLDCLGYHLHCFSAGSPHITRHVAFRDYLICHRSDAARYAALKRQVFEASGGDRALYSNGKSAFVAELEQRALAWHARQKPSSTPRQTAP